MMVYIKICILLSNSMHVTVRHHTTLLVDFTKGMLLMENSKMHSEILSYITFYR